MEVATGQEGEADTANKDVRTAELPPLWMWKMGCGEGLLPYARLWGGHDGRCHGRGHEMR